MSLSDNPPEWVFKFLSCPKCKNELCFNNNLVACVCNNCNSVYEYQNSIIKFVNDNNYSQTFGDQWNKFSKTQIDSFANSKESFLRFFNETNFSAEELSEGVTLDAGCGAGRFMDIALRYGAKVIGLDYSSSVIAASQNMNNLNHNKNNYILIQASIYEMPIKNCVIDRVYSIGVLQHMPHRRKAVIALSNVLKTNGRISMWVYEKSFRSLLGYKYWIRPMVKKLSLKQKLILSKSLVILFLPLGLLFNCIPVLNKYFLRFLPFAFRKPRKKSSLKEILEWSVLDTYDNISPEYDNPISEKNLISWFKDSNIIEIKRLVTPSLALTGKKK
jgi:SAM-dependent methyltransferase